MKNNIQRTVLLLLIFHISSNLAIQDDLFTIASSKYFKEIYKNHSRRLIFLKADDEDTSWLNTEKVAVSLGYNCTVAVQLDFENIRIRAFPFDWSFSPIDGVIRCIKNDFYDFFSLENITINSQNYIIDSLYDITILHDFPFQQISNLDLNEIIAHFQVNNLSELIRKQYHETQIKFLRRVKRFKQLREYKGEIFFIRFSKITKQEALELLNALDQKFNDSTFTLIVIGHTEDFEMSWNIPKLKNYFVPESTWNLVFHRGLLTNIFKDAKLL